MHLLEGHSLKFNSKLVVLHVLVWGALLGLPYLLNASREYSIDASTLPQFFFSVTNSLHAVLFYVNAYWLYPRYFNRGKRWQYAIAVLMAILIFFYAKILLIQSGFFTFTLESSLLPILFFPTVLFVLISIVYRLVIDKRSFENERLNMELKFLRSQINPHFLFNVLNNMVSLARKKSDQLEPSLIKLSGLMRYMLYESADQTVPLAKEVDYLNNYIELQKIRFSEDVAIRADLGDVSNAYRIEPMLLISFVENAFKHGVGMMEDPKITILLSVEDDRLFFEVANTLNDQDQQKDRSSGIGLKNVQKRLSLLYPDLHHLEISRSKNMFKIQLKLILK